MMYNELLHGSNPTDALLLAAIALDNQYDDVNLMLNHYYAERASWGRLSCMF